MQEANFQCGRIHRNCLVEIFCESLVIRFANEFQSEQFLREINRWEQELIIKLTLILFAFLRKQQQNRNR